MYTFKRAAADSGVDCVAMTDVSSFSVDDLGDYLIDNEIHSNAVLLLCRKRPCGLTRLPLSFPICDCLSVSCII